MEEDNREASEVYQQDNGLIVGMILEACPVV